MGIDVATLIQETNYGSSRWFRSAAWVPEETLPLDSLLRTPSPPPPPPPPLGDSAQGDTETMPRSRVGDPEPEPEPEPETEPEPDAEPKSYLEAQPRP